MSDSKNIDNPPGKEQCKVEDENIAPESIEVSKSESVTTIKTSQQISSERQIKFERAQKCLENAALVSKRIKEQRKATAELLGRPFEDDDVDATSEMASTMSERTGYSAVTDVSTTLSVQEALNIPGISESLANTLKQKELLLERIKQYKEISKKPTKSTASVKRDITRDYKKDVKKYADNSEITQLITTVKEKENAMSVMVVKMKAMETTILDLQEKIHEKDQIIEAKNMATALMSDTLSKKEKDSLVLLEDTKQQMTKMQENFVAMEAEWKQEKLLLLKDIETKEEKISNLEEANSILEASRFEISVEHAKLAEQIDFKNKEIMRLEETIQNLSQVNIETAKEKTDVEEEKGSLEISGMAELTKKIELLEQINCQIRQTNKELENKLATINVESKTLPGSSPSNKGSPLPSRKGGRNTASKMKSPWSKLSSETLPQESDKKLNKNEITRLEMLVQSLNKDILEKEYIISQKESDILELSVELKKHNKNFEKIDVGVCTYSDERDSNINIESKEDVIKSETEHEGEDTKEVIKDLKAAQEQIVLLTNEIDVANKNMIKVKSAHKLKLKQMQKTIDNFSKVSDSNAEIVKLNEELHQLSQKVAELEEEKGNLQLHLVDYDSGRLTESDVYKKMVEMEALAETRLRAISVLETQKFDLVQELHVLQQRNNEMEDKLADMTQIQSEQVCSEIKSVQMEEQIDQLVASKKELVLIIENLKLDKEQLNSAIKVAEEEKDELMHKLENYIQENMELHDKLEKMSAEKVSSAESIEIVESLTTQEKLELEEYNKNILENKGSDHGNAVNTTSSSPEKIESLIEQSEDLTNKIELFTQEREEVMEKMKKLSEENEILHKQISDLNNQYEELQNNIQLLNNEKSELHDLNNELNRQLEETKRERVEIMKETAEIVKSANIEDTSEAAPQESQQEEKLTIDKGVNRTKSVKQLTKEILKLKNVIKDREAEIADCEMKILSLEEQQQKQNDILQSNASLDNKIKALTEENTRLKEDIKSLKPDNETEQQLVQYKHAHAMLQQEIQKVHKEYAVTVNTRETRINELENVLVEYEKQLFNYGSTLQQKDKEISEYINQITQLNDISKKLKNTVDMFEEEKTKDQNGELLKSLNKQITVLQKKLMECEEKVRILEEDKKQLLLLQTALENKNVSLDTELRKLQESYAEKQAHLKELQGQHLKHSEEKSALMLQSKERDEEIHEIKLQLRKESIENEKLRTSLTSKEDSFNDLLTAFNNMKAKLDMIYQENNNLSRENSNLEVKHKETMEKLKKFAFNLKKKTSLNAELETKLVDTQNQLKLKNHHLDQLLIQVETLPVIQDKLKLAEEEINRLQSQKVTIDHNKTQEINQLQSHILSLESQFNRSSHEIINLKDTISAMQNQLDIAHEENLNLESQIQVLSKKLAEYEIEQKNSTNFETKIYSLETDITQKENQISDLLEKIEHLEQSKTQIQFGFDAKIQERDLYIENLETETSKYKNRICRLEETISVMEDRRHSLERKADQLGSQLEEKQKAYSDYTNQEDELIGRLAVLMDHDRVVEKQLNEIENENKDIHNKMYVLTEENQRLMKSLTETRDLLNTLDDKAARFDIVESELTKYQSELHNVEAHLKRVLSDNQMLLAQKKKEIEELEMEYNTQIENSIKDKKSLSEKYEKAVERVSLLEGKLQEYSDSIEILKKNLEDVNKINQEFIEKSTIQENVIAPDYTEQYINEINKLNSIINNKNQEISEMANRVQTIQMKNVPLIADLESKISELSFMLNLSDSEKEKFLQNEDLLKQNIEHLQLLLNQKEEQIRELVEKKKLTFEMNIPKTEGMLISSTIEPMSDDQKSFDIASIESQIVPSILDVPVIKKDSIENVFEQIKTEPVGNVLSEMSVEPVIVPKKSYLCFSEDDKKTNIETDIFNSEEGWGLGDSEDVGDVTPGFTHLNEKIKHLKNDNEALKSELEMSNSKLIKALKKLKELKSCNEMLSKEIKLSKQLAQSNFLDTAIEDELRTNIQNLEKKIEELSSDLNKEKREKEMIKKQNEVFSNANDKLMEMKEKFDNEIELWKYKFKEASDKLSTVQWNAENKDSPQHESNVSIKNINEDKIKEDMIKIEKENDELQSTVDQLMLQNNEFASRETQLQLEISNLNNQLKQQMLSNKSEEDLQSRLQESQLRYTELLTDNNTLSNKIYGLEINLKEAIENIESLKIEREKLMKDIATERETLELKCSTLEQEVEHFKHAEIEAKEKVTQLISELDTNKLQIVHYEQQANLNSSVKDSAMTEKYFALEERCQILEQNLKDANAKIKELELKNCELENMKLNGIEEVNKLSMIIQDLNKENDNLLSTVAELRSSVSSAVDQRGFEIAELWKQHLAQREIDFQEMEHELRLQLSASESKYEQLLDNVQSSSQEETNKLIVMEQMNSLQSKLLDKDEHISSLQQKYAETINQLDILRSEMDDEKITHENKVLEQQEEYEKIISELRNKNMEDCKEYDTTLNTLQTELNTFKVNNNELLVQNEELSSKLEDLNVKIVDLTNELRQKESEIYQKTHDYNATLSLRNEEFESVRKHLTEYEKKIEDLTYEKESELAVLRLKMHENMNHYVNLHRDSDLEKADLELALNEKIAECTNLNRQITDLNKNLEESSLRTTEMQTALENQEIEIVSLKDEITSLQNMLRVSNSKIQKHVSFASDTKQSHDDYDESVNTLSKELLDAVPRAELDLALYMLHQRDVRCEELTMELTQLLEERDTLQLRLSDSLRSHEELKVKCKAAGMNESVISSQETITGLPAFGLEKEQQFVDIHRGQTSRSSSISDPDADKPKLQAKLTELRSVKHNRDVRLRHESEQRQMDLRLLQRDVANLPPEAVDQLAQAHHTLSRDSQSTPTVLLNWLRGKSTPKVVHM